MPASQAVATPSGGLSGIWSGVFPPRDSLREVAEGQSRVALFSVLSWSQPVSEVGLGAVFPHRVQ